MLGARVQLTNFHNSLSRFVEDSPEAIDISPSIFCDAIGNGLLVICASKLMRPRFNMLEVKLSMAVVWDGNNSGLKKIAA